MNKGMKIFIGVFCGLVIATIAVLICVIRWLDDLNAIPAVTIPSPAMPSPNARDIYVAASNKIVQPDVLMNALRISRGYALPPDHIPTLLQIQSAVDSNAPVLTAMRKGVQFEYHEIPQRSFSPLVSPVSKFRVMEYLLVVDTRQKIVRGDWHGAMTNCLDGMHLGTVMPDGGGVFCDLDGIACYEIAVRECWDIVDHLSAADAGAGARRLEAIIARETPFYKVEEEEKWLLLAGLIELFQRPDWRMQLTRLSGSSLKVSPPIYWFVNKRKAIAHVTAFMDTIIADAKKPYVYHHPEPPLPDDPVCHIVLPTYEKAFAKHTTVEADRRLLLVALALRAYRLKYGRYPATLAALVPGYLNAVPTDPFAKSGQLRYKLSSTGYLLYSVGPDGNDNHGTPSPDGQFRKGLKFSVLGVHSTGDIVAGVNFISL